MFFGVQTHSIACNAKYTFSYQETKLMSSATSSKLQVKAAGRAALLSGSEDESGALAIIYSTRCSALLFERLLAMAMTVVTWTALRQGGRILTISAGTMFRGQNMWKIAKFSECYLGAIMAPLGST